MLLRTVGQLLLSLSLCCVLVTLRRLGSFCCYWSFTFFGWTRGGWRDRPSSARADAAKCPTLAREWKSDEAMSNDDGGGGEHDALKATTTEKKKQETENRGEGERMYR